MSLRDKSKIPELWDCAACQGEKHKCLLTGDSISVTVPARPQMGHYILESIKDVRGMLAWARTNEADSRLTDLAIMIRLGVCPLPLFTALSLELWKLFNLGQATQRYEIVPGGHYEQPAIYLNAMNIMAAEQAIIRAEEKERGIDGNA